MAETLDDITITYEEEGKLLTKELDKIVLTKGSWATLMFKYVERDRKTDEFGPPKVSIRRYRKYGGRYQLQSKFTISSMRQGRQIIEILEKWCPSDAAGGEEEES
ncbi:MAG: hypothetical protein C4523_01390 [Myxococcales bacterium]|nr:MAG: hypothetical protein C4523_01390 [Myxococcales bacterium]